MINSEFEKSADPMTNQPAMAAAYVTGEEKQTKWGAWRALDAAEDGSYCKKYIRVDPNNAISVQTHAMRREHWKVLSGTLIVILDGERKELTAGQDIKIPLGSVHSMANLAGVPVEVEELQEAEGPGATCNEGDILRYGTDLYGRETIKDSTDPKIVASNKLFDVILADIAKAKAPNPAPVQKP